MPIRQFSTRLITFCATLVVVCLIAIVASAQEKTQSSTKGTPEVASHNLSGTVVQVEGNNLLVKMTSGEMRVFTPPADQKFVIDGKPVSLSDLKPGTKLNATYTETRTPITDRTVQTISGNVWFVAPPNVILRLPSGENRQFVVKDTVKFHRSDGGDMTVFDLRKGMDVTAERITEVPRVELASTRTVTGTAPTQAAAAPKQPPMSAASGATPPPTAAPAAAPTAAPTTGAAPAHLPKTGSPVPLVGLLGLLLAGASFAIRRYRQE
jgi:LPXTG-motif cell wall-anchored protein